MDFKDDPIWWWKHAGDNYLSGFSDPGDIWEHRRLWEDKELLKRFPLAQEYLDYFLQYRVSGIKLINQEYGFGTITPISVCPIKFEIKINQKKSFDEQVLTLAHECVHGFYRINGTFWQGEEEATVDGEAKRFLMANNEYKNKLEKLLNPQLLLFE